MLDTRTNDTTLVRSVMTPSRSDRSSRPSSVRPNQRSVAPVRCGDQLPRHDVGVVLHLGDDDLVARAAGPRRAAVGPGDDVGDQVERLGGVLGEDDLGAVGGVDERGDLVARALVQRGRLLGEHVDAAVHVGVVPRVVVVDRVEDLPRLLRGRGVVEVDQRLSPWTSRSRTGKSLRTFSTSRAGAVERHGSCRVRRLGQELLVALGLEACRRAPGRPPRRSGRRRRRARSRAGCSAGSGCSA